MARPTVPEADKKRTVPFRMSKPDYRTLMILMKVTDTTIQEHLRTALKSYLDSSLRSLTKTVEFPIPTAYEIADWSDDAFNRWLTQRGRRDPEKKPAARRGLSRSPAAQAA